MAPDDNKYVNHLAEELGKRGCEVKSIHLYWQKAVILDLAKIAWFALFRRYKILHVHWMYLFPTMLKMRLEYLFFRMLGLKIVWTIHNILPHVPGIKDRERGQWFFNRADKKIIHFESNIPELEQKLGIESNRDLHVIPHAEYAIFPNDISRESARRKLGISLESRVLLCFGLVRKNRGYKYFIEAIEKLGNNYTGVIVGKPDNKSEGSMIERKAEQLSNLKVDLRWVADYEVQIFMNASDVVVLPYTHVTTSGVAMLAFSFSKPVIATSLGSLPEIVEKDMGILVEPKNTEDLIEAIESIFKLNLSRMGKYAKKRVEQKYSWDSVVDNTLDVYSGVFE